MEHADETGFRTRQQVTFTASRGIEGDDRARPRRIRAGGLRRRRTGQRRAAAEPVLGPRSVTLRRSALEDVPPPGRPSWRKRYAVALAVLGAGVLVATQVSWSRACAPRSGVVSTTVCYVALSNDLTPLLGARVAGDVAASPECATHFERGEAVPGGPTMPS